MNGKLNADVNGPRVNVGGGVGGTAIPVGCRAKAGVCCDTPANENPCGVGEEKSAKGKTYAHVAEEEYDCCAAPKCCPTDEKEDNCSAVEKACSADKKENGYRAAGTACCTSKTKADDCCATEKKADDCCFTGKEADDCCATKKKADNCCSTGKEADDCYATEKKADDCCSTGKEADDCCANDNKVGVYCSANNKKTNSYCVADKNDNRNASDKTCSSENEEEKYGCCRNEKKKPCCAAPVPLETADNPVTSSCADDHCSIENNELDEKVNSSAECVDDCCKLLPDNTGALTTPVCTDHLRAAFERYESLIAEGKCLCRSVFEQMGFCCCSVTPDSACGSHAERSEIVGAKNAGRKVPEDIEIHSLCSHDEPQVTTNVKSGAKVKKSDVEQAAPPEHVVLSVSGMTCTGCSRKMMNVLDRIPGLSNAQVTFVSEMAEFDLDSSIAQIEHVLPQVEKETGFKCSRILSGYQNLDVLMSPAMAKQFKDACPVGVFAITQAKNKTYRIMFDPRVIGARSVLPPNVHLAPPARDVGITEGKRRLRNMAWSTGFAAALTVPIVVLNWSNNPVSHSTRSVVSLVLATFVQGIAIPEFYIGALKSLVYSRVIEMDMLVVISITAAYSYSLVAFALTAAGFDLEQKAFFETSSLLITLVLFGRLMAAFARLRAVSAVSLRSLQTETALLIQGKYETTKIDARLLQFGDVVKILPHSRIVTDGNVVFGESAVDESMVTGESTPIAKQTGDPVMAGTINCSGILHVQLTRLPGENSITDIANLVENAVSAKPRVQDLADKVALWFIPAVIGMAIVVFATWIAIALKVRQMSAGGALGLAITYAIAVLAVSCPCALGLAVPMVLVIAGGLAARAGVIIKAADAIERGFKITDAVFDKTGTLSNGDLQITYEEVFPASIEENEALALTRSLIEGNEHPVSVAVASHLDTRFLPMLRLEKTQSIPGAGIQAYWNGSTIRAGNPYWLGLEDHPVIAQLLNQGMTYFCVTFDGQLLLAYGLKSTLREEAATVIAELQRRRIHCHIVSGDGPKIVEDVARTLGIEVANTVARRSPAEKQQYIKNLQSRGKVALFCGDGTNDAVAVAQANVGVKVGSASDVTGAAADIVLLGGLEGVLTLLDVSRRASIRIHFNFAWAAVYNVLAISMAAGAFVKFRIPPAYAGIGEIVSVGPVILAASSLALGGKTV